MKFGRAGLRWCRTVSRIGTGHIVRYKGILRRLAIIDGGFVEDQVGLRLGLAGASVLDLKTAALVHVGEVTWGSTSCAKTTAGHSPARRQAGR